MRYQIVDGASTAHLAELVQKLLDAGWRLAGGAFCSTVKQRGTNDITWEEYWFHQAMTLPIPVNYRRLK